MFERFTEKARRVIFFARYEASQLGSERIETEHLLLGLFREDKELAARFLGGELPEGAAPAAAPADLMGTEKRIQYIVHRMESAIANQEFEKARFYSAEERKERENLRQLHRKYGLGEPRLEAIRKEIEAVTERRPKVSTSIDLPLTSECKRVLVYAAEESRRLNHEHIGTQHLLLGLLREEGSLAARILQDHALHLPEVREKIARWSPAEEGRTGSRFRPGPSAAFGHGAAGRRFGGHWSVALEDAGRVAPMARHVAAERRSPCIETTDLLLALTHEKEVAERFLGAVETIRKHPAFERGPRERVSEVELAFSEDCKLVFNFAIEEAAQLGQRTGPGHLLLGILRVESCAAAEILREYGFTEAGIRAQLSPPPPSSDPEQGRNYV